MTSLRVLAIGFALSVSPDARASSPFFPYGLDPIVFEAVATPATGICPDPCFQVRVFLEDPTRNREIQAIQFDIDVAVGARVPPLPIPPAANSNASAGNAVYSDDESGIAVLPWNLSATVGASPRDGFDALVVVAADHPLSVASLAERRALFPNCAPRAACQILEDADAHNRIHLGSFKVTRDGDPLTQAFEVRVGGVTGVGEWLSDYRWSYVQNFYAQVFYPVPEPASLPIGGLLGALAVIRAWLRSERASPGASAARH